MASLKEVKMRIASVESTKKITQARQMISSAHMHRAQGLLDNAATYSHALESVVATLCDPEQPLQLPYTEPREKGAVAVVIMASNSGMCGAFNSRMAKEVGAIEKQYAGQDLLFYPIGKKLRKAIAEAGHAPQGEYDKLAGKADYTEAAKLVDDLMQQLMSGKVKKVDLVYYRYRNMAVQNITHDSFLPYTPPQVKDAAAKKFDGYLLEPPREQLAAEILPQALKAKFYAALMDNHTSEHAARTMAMQLATENADEMLDELRLNYNKLRQQNITSELLDIMGGSFA
jgi:F-type H+-transporting ATPase subunit gamma